MPPTRPIRAANRLILGLPAADRRRLLESCVPVDLAFGELLADAGAPIRHVYFPTGSFVSLLSPAEPSARIEVGLVGNEGMVGVSLALGASDSPVRALVQGRGGAWRIDARNFRRQLARSPALQKQLNRYAYVMMVQLAQTAACNRFHRVDARLARWLLMTHDRAASKRFYLTHEFLAEMLGVRRVGVTNAATALQRRELIRYSRGDITILNRRGLEAASCGCYRVVQDAFNRVLG